MNDPVREPCVYMNASAFPLRIQIWQKLDGWGEGEKKKLEREEEEIILTVLY